MLYDSLIYLSAAYIFFSCVAKNLLFPSSAHIFVITWTSVLWEI